MGKNREPRKTLYIIRHGVTRGNEEGRIVGHSDLALSDRGRKQAEGAGLMLESCRLDLALTSPLARTRETAEIVLRNRDLRAEPEPRLIELALDGWEGRARSELRSDPKWNRWIEAPHRYPTSGGDMLDDVRHRAVAALSDGLQRIDDGGGLAIFTHAGVARLLMLHLLEMPVAKYHKIRCDCASVNAMEVTAEGGQVDLARMLALNVTQPLRAISGKPSG